MTVMRSKVINNELPVVVVVLVALAVFTTHSGLVSGEQQQQKQKQPCAGMITKPYMRAGSGPPCVNPDHSPVSLDPALAMKMADLAISIVEGDGLVGEANLPARRKLATGDAEGSAGGGILTLIIIVAIIWCCCTGRCGCGRQVVVVTQPAVSQSQANAHAHSQTVTVPVTLINHMPARMPEQNPSVHYNNVVHYGPAGQPAVPTPGVGDLEMRGSFVDATGNAGNGFAHAQVGSGGLPGIHHNLQTVPGTGGWIERQPAPGFPGYTHQAHHAPPAQQVQRYPAQPQQAQYP